jgi:hypothetical protein
MPANLSELVAAEITNLDATTKSLDVSALVISDIESLCEKLTPLIKRPAGNLDSSDELLAVKLIIHELMMCRMLLTNAALAAMRMYQGDAFTHLRRAIETCAFAVRMSKHHDLSRIWAESGLDKNGEDTKYRAYRKAFRTADVFPNKDHPDHDPLLTHLKGGFDLCSKTIHGSVFGMAGHFVTSKNRNAPGSRHVNLF